MFLPILSACTDKGNKQNTDKKTVAVSIAPQATFVQKIVGDKFAEKKSIKQVDPNKLEKRAKLQAIVDSVVTDGRVTKLVHKMVDEGIIPEDWDEHNMATIAKNIGKEVYYDCVKEEPETVEQVGELFGKLASGTAMRIVRNMLG